MVSEMSGADGDSAASLQHTFKYLLATQFLSRGIPFIFNSWIIRHLTEEDYAVYAVQFHLFVTCILFLSREGFRRACMRADIRCDGASATGANAAKLLKVAWMTLPLGILVTLGACIFVFWWQDLSYSSPYAHAILINGFACILELLAEPFYILSQTLVLLRLRLFVETVATLSRCMVTYILIMKQSSLEKSIIFGLSQVAYGASIFLGYWGYFLFFRVYNSSVLFPFRSLKKNNTRRKFECLSSGVAAAYNIADFQSQPKRVGAATGEASTAEILRCWRKQLVRSRSHRMLSCMIFSRS